MYYYPLWKFYRFFQDIPCWSLNFRHPNACVHIEILLISTQLFSFAAHVILRWLTKRRSYWSSYWPSDTVWDCLVFHTYSCSDWVSCPCTHLTTCRRYVKSWHICAICSYFCSLKVETCNILYFTPYMLSKSCASSRWKWWRLVNWHSNNFCSCGFHILVKMWNKIWFELFYQYVMIQMRLNKMGLQ